MIPTSTTVFSTGAKKLTILFANSSIVKNVDSAGATITVNNMANNADSAILRMPDTPPAFDLKYNISGKPATKAKYIIELSSSREKLPIKVLAKFMKSFPNIS